jgi:hypothetical protein
MVVRVNTTAKRLLDSNRSPDGPVAKQLSVSLYPAHKQTLDQRERELNVGRSILLQMLLEIEQREGLLRRELLNRLRAQNNRNNKPQGTQ